MAVIPVSESFLVLLGYQLGQFADCPEVRSLVVYVTHATREGAPSLIPVGHWPPDGRTLAAVDGGSRLRVPAEERRWLPLRDGAELLGALQGAWSCEDLGACRQQQQQGLAAAEGKGQMGKPLRH